MRQTFKSHQFEDENGNPAGGHSFGPGFSVSWQNGPLGQGEERVEANGAFVETLIDVCIDRLQFYQNSKFACEENATAILNLKEALLLLEDRTAKRNRRGVEGTHTV